MASLASLTADPIEMIVSYLEDDRDLLCLFLCGNQALTDILRRKIHDLSITLHSEALSWNAQQWAFLPNLRTFSIHGAHVLNSTTMRMVAAHLPKCLIELRMGQLYSREMWTEFATPQHPKEHPTFTLGEQTVFLTCLSSRFPQLTVCHLPKGTLHSQTNSEVAFHFVENLPRTVTDLELHGIEDLPLKVWSLLPPNLERLGPMKLMPAAISFPPSLFESLRSLDLDINASQLKNYLTPDASATSPAAAAARVIKLPPNLTSLIATVPSMPQPNTCPSTLTSLTLHGKGANLLLDNLLDACPRRLVSLSLHRVHLTRGFIGRQILKKRANRDYESLLHLTLTEMDRTSDDAVSALITLSTNLETYYNTGSSLNVQQLAMFGSNIQSISSGFLPACFSPQSTLPTLTSLQTLDIHEGGKSPKDFAKDFQFSKLPPNVTCVSVHNTAPINDDRLQQLPSSVEYISVRKLGITGRFQDLMSVLYRSSSPSQHVVPANSFVMMPEVAIRVNNSGDGPRFVFEPSVAVVPNQILPTLELLPQTLQSLPRTLTELDLSNEGYFHGLTPESFPNLAKLTLENVPFKSNDYSRFLALEYLSVANWTSPNASPGACMFPLNLKTFKTTSMISLSLGRELNFPLTLTEVQFGQLNPTSLLRPLPNLTSISFLSSYSMLPSAMKGLLELESKSVTRLEAYYQITIGNIAHFANLQVWKRAIVSDSILMHILDRNNRENAVQLHLERPELTVIENKSKLLAQLKMTPGTLNDIVSKINQRAGSVIGRSLSKALESIYPFVTHLTFSSNLQTK